MDHDVCKRNNRKAIYNQISIANGQVSIANEHRIKVKRIDGGHANGKATKRVVDFQMNKKKETKNSNTTAFLIIIIYDDGY